jgi:hypothetical protein
VVRRKSIQPGSIALNNERKIAEAIAKRSAEMRSALSKEGKAHVEFLTKCVEEKREAKTEVAKLSAKLISTKAALADITSPYYTEKRKWLSGKKENEILRAELVKKIADAKAYAETQRIKSEAISKIEADLKGRLTKLEEIVRNREVVILAREIDLKRGQDVNVREDKRIAAAVKALSDNEREYAARVKALTVREQKAEAVLARELRAYAEEMRVDLKAKAVQDKDKALQVERVGIARERARLGRIRHQKQGAVK